MNKMNKVVAPYGSWRSPISSQLIVTGSIRLGHIVLDGDAVYWIEGRPSENGRSVIVRWSPDGGIEEMTPAGYNVRSRVHEYGGGEFTVHDEIIYFVNDIDQRLYTQYPYSEAEPLSSADNLRFADGEVDPSRGRLYCIREDHASTHDPKNSLVTINLDGFNEKGDVLAEGNDFYATPRISPDGRKLAWITWNHPNMPWDSTELWVGDLTETGQLTNAVKVAGDGDESIFQPSWSPDGVLHFVSDRTNWWNLYRWQDGTIEALYPMAAEFGMPQWVFDMRTYGFESADAIICTYKQNGISYLARLNTKTKTLTEIKTPFTSIGGRNGSFKVGDGAAVFVGGSAVQPNAVVRLDLTSGKIDVLRQSTTLSVDPSFLSTPEPIAFPTENEQTAYGIFYPPTNGKYEAPEGEKPPLIVTSHGGPTAATDTTMDLRIQYWTSRGLAVLDVNYSGSTGYGRAYRQRLNGEWGVLDVQDCINGAQYLVGQGLVDGNRLAIRGGSAGGYTTLSALTFYDVFTAGASYYGISDIEALAKETHKFESRYLDRLIAPYPEGKEVYIARSPIHHTNKIKTPLILFQGLEDKVVPPNQSEKLFNAVKEKGLPVAYVAFEDESHGFRQAPNIRQALDAELYFYSRVFGFELAEPVKPVPIENLGDSA